MVIGLCGAKGAGKDTVGEYLVSQYGFDRFAFADKLKEAVCALFNMSYDDINRFKNNPLVTLRIYYEDGLTVANYWTFREILQRMGTEVGRDVFGKDFWVDLIEEEIKGSSKAVITDVRFDNEINLVKRHNSAVMWRIERSKSINNDAHASEQLATQKWFEGVTIKNDGTVRDLYNTVDAIMESYELISKPQGVQNVS